MSEPNIAYYYKDAVTLLKSLVAIPSFSKEEDGTADILTQFFDQKGIACFRVKNNVYAVSKNIDSKRPTILLNSHHDTVKPNAAYTNDPFNAFEKDGKLYGLGTTDAGASLVSLIQAFIHFYDKPLPFNLVLAASAEEEISGKEGIELLFSLPEFAALFNHPESFAIVGEPTKLQLAIAEKGLMVVDAISKGVPGHAARDEGDNAIYKALKDVNWIKYYRFEKVSTLLGEVKMTVTGIEAPNKAHNIIPDTCSYMVDIRLNELYTHEEILSTLGNHLSATLTPRSTRIKPSFIPADHPVIMAGKDLGKSTFGSPTTSDQALIPLPSLKCGPGSSEQSHSANEYIELADIKAGIVFYIDLLNKTAEQYI